MSRHAPFAAALLVAACAVAPPAPIPLEGLPEAFEMGGRMSVAHAGQGEIFRIRWTHAPGAGVWTLATPVGTEVARIERSAGGLVVHRPGAAPVHSASFAELTEHLFGAALDERLLVAWLHGRALAGPGNWAVTIDQSQRLEGLEVARRVTAAREDTVLKLVVDDYRLPAR